MASEEKQTIRSRMESLAKERVVQIALFAVVGILLIVLVIIVINNTRFLVEKILPKEELYESTELSKLSDDRFQKVTMRNLRMVSDAVNPKLEIKEEDKEPAHLTEQEKMLENSFWLSPEQRLAKDQPYFYIINTDVILRYDLNLSSLANRLNYVTPFIEIILIKALERQKPSHFRYEEMRNSKMGEEIRDEINFYLQFPKSYLEFFIGKNKTRDFNISNIPIIGDEALRLPEQCKKNITNCLVQNIHQVSFQNFIYFKKSF